MSDETLFDHLAEGLTTICRCWLIRRRDGVVYGFTDHDMPVSFGDTEFTPESGMSAKAIVQATGLSVDNTEAMGALSDEAISEADIEAGRFDGAEVEAWLVNWCDPEARHLRFAGSIGELRRAGGAFHAELRGLTEALNQPQGLVYHRACSAVLGDGRCKVDVTMPGFAVEAAPFEVVDDRIFVFDGVTDNDAGWFARGELTVLTGAAEGLTDVIKHDRIEQSGRRVIELWQPLGAPVVAGDSMRLVAGCDKRAETCRVKFDNLLNFRGFPDLPGEDWLVSVPRRDNDNDGASRRRMGSS